jgi:hypothetical protein
MRDIIAAAIVASALALLVLFAYDWSGHRGADHVKAEWDKAIAQAKIDAAALERRQAAAIADIDRQHTDALKEKADEISDLRARVAAGSDRLRVAARCPVQPAAAGAGVDHGKADGPAAVSGPAGDAYLDQSSEPYYFALMEGLVHQREQLLACQEILASERAP